MSKKLVDYLVPYKIIVKNSIRILKGLYNIKKIYQMKLVEPNDFKTYGKLISDTLMIIYDIFKT